MTQPTKPLVTRANRVIRVELVFEEIDRDTGARLCRASTGASTLTDTKVSDTTAYDAAVTYAATLDCLIAVEADSRLALERFLAKRKDGGA